MDGICEPPCNFEVSKVVVHVVLQEKVANAQEVKDLAMSSLSQSIEDEKKEQWRAEGRSLLFDAKRVDAALHSSCTHRST